MLTSVLLVKPTSVAVNYSERLGKPDFRVRYRWFPPSEDGFFQRPFQHMRCDFSYEGDDVAKTGIYMIHPEFEDANHSPLPEGQEVPHSGTATMWIVNRDTYREFHREKVRPDVRCFFMVGSRRIAEAEVIDILGLAE